MILTDQIELDTNQYKPTNNEQKYNKKVLESLCLFNIFRVIKVVSDVLKCLFDGQIDVGHGRGQAAGATINHDLIFNFLLFLGIDLDFGLVLLDMVEK